MIFYLGFKKYLDIIPFSQYDCISLMMDAKEVLEYNAMHWKTRLEI